MRDGRIVAAAREDRFTRRPADPDFPRQSVEYCLRAGKIGPAGLGAAVLSGPARYRDSGGGAAASFLRRITGRGRDDDPVKVIARELDADVPGHTVDRQTALAAGAFLPSPFEEAAVLVLGDEARATPTAIARGRGTSLEILETVPALSASQAAEHARRARDATTLDRLVVSGPGAAARETVAALTRGHPFSEVWVQPAAAAGADALGAALRFASGDGEIADRAKIGRALGPGYNAHQIRTFLRSRDVQPEELPRDDTAPAIAALLAEGRTVGWFAGRLGLGDDTAATRSVLCRPDVDTGPAGESILAVPDESAAEHFEIDPGVRSPLAAAVPVPACRERLGPAGAVEADPVLVFRADRQEHRAFHDLLSAVGSGGGLPVLAVRPLASAGQPVACTPRDAYEAFAELGIDALAMERYLVRART